jgi:histidinol-phosphate aminotransferase
VNVPIRVNELTLGAPRYPFKAPAAPARPDAVWARLGSNESAFAPLPGVLDAVAAADGITRYPDPRADELRTRLASHLAVDPARIAVGPGSVAIIDQLIRLVVRPGDEIVMAQPSFAAYRTLTQLAGGRVVAVPVAGTAVDLAAMARAVTDRTRILFVCTPNNPTGGTVTVDAVLDLLAHVPGDLLVVVDEAYCDFAFPETTARSVESYGAHRNVVVLRTFSKAYGLAGLRVGYCLADPAVIELLLSTQVPFAVSAPAQAAARASLDRAADLRQRVTRTVAERSRVHGALREIGLAVAPSSGNFLWIPTGDDTTRINDELARRGVEVRPIGELGLRVTVGSPRENDLFLDAITSAARTETAAREPVTLGSATPGTESPQP